MKNMFLHIVDKRSLLGLASFILPLVIFAQSQYDYYDDDAVAGGADRVLSGLIIIFIIVAVAIALLFIVFVIAKVYYWFNPEADPELKRRNAIEKEKKKHEEFVQKQRQEAKPEAIDLGLSVKWASFNLGAYKPSDIGSLFYWAENNPSKRGGPCYKDINVHAIGDIAGNPKYDAAAAHYGNNWRLPSGEECQELIDLCKWVEKTIDGNEGRLVIGPNGNSIFLPYNQKQYISDKLVSGHYWSSTPHFAYKSSSKYIGFGENCKKPAEIWGGSANSCLFGIRPVFNEVPNDISSKQIKSEVRKFHEIINMLDVQRDDSLYKVYEERYINKEDENVFEDEHGVKYSMDGKCLLDADNCNCSVYYIKEGTEHVNKDAINVNVFNGFSFSRKVRKLEKIILPSSLIWFPASSVPNNCAIESNSIYYSVIDGLFIDNRKKSVVKCLNKFINKVKIYEPVEIIEDNAFIDCKELEDVVLPETLKAIGNSAFANCTSLCYIKIPDSVHLIADYAFYGCKSLNINSLPKSLVYIGLSTFQWCKFENVIIPKNIKSIGISSFGTDCNNVTSESERFIIKESLLIDSKTNEVLQFVDSSRKQVIIPDNIIKIYSNAFSHTGIESIIIPSSTKEIGNSLFYGCNNLQKVQIDCQIEKLPRFTFAGCTSLTNVILPESIKVFEVGAFSGCKSLIKLKLKDGLRTIENRVFEGCENIMSINIPVSLDNMGGNCGNCFPDCPNLNEIYYDAEAASIVRLPTNIKTIIIGENVKSLPHDFIIQNEKLRSLTIPKNVQRIKIGSILYCSNLKEMSIFSKSIILEEGWIRGCDNIAIIRIPKDSYDILFPLLPKRKGLKIKKIYDHHFLFFKW